MSRAVTLLLVLGLVSCAAAKPPAPVPPTVVPPPPPRVPTLAIETRYAPDLTLTLRLDGAPATGDVFLTPLAAGGFEGSPGDPVSEPPGDESLALVRVGEGVYAAPADGLARLTASPGFVVVASGRRYPYPQPFGTHPAHCAAGLAAVRKMDACVDRRPSPAAPPAMCDDAGVAGFQLVVSELADRYDACWSAPTDEAIKRLDRIDAPDLRSEACRRLAVIVGPNVETSLGMRLVPTCAPHFAEPTRTRLLLARRTADFPAAFEKAKTGTSLEMRAFYVEYAITADPRLEDLRKLAAERFGPKKREAFLATRRALAALTKDGWFVQLCDVGTERVEIAIVHGVAPKFSQVDEPSASSSCLLKRVMMRPPRRPPAGLVERGVALARARTGVKQVEWRWGCATDHWYFDLPKASLTAPGK